MAELATLARPYANAAFGLAKKDKELDRWSRMLGMLDAVAHNERVASLLASPEITSTGKAFRLIETLGDELNDRSKKFVQVLADNGRLELIGEIAAQFETLKAVEEQSLDVHVISAFALSDAETEKLSGALAKRFDKSVVLTSVVDAQLLGGAIIRAGDIVIDGSIRGRLNKLTETLHKT
ncbi:MAG: F0F1 ATP synthase subunit delta [Proteobacteria bacterium]|nr:F0F1 ATP synthase subunit delta [Pseudomonadota bacterium]